MKTITITQSHFCNIVDVNLYHGYFRKLYCWIKKNWSQRFLVLLYFSFVILSLIAKAARRSVSQEKFTQAFRPPLP